MVISCQQPLSRLGVNLPFFRRLTYEELSYGVAADTIAASNECHFRYWKGHGNGNSESWGCGNTAQRKDVE